MKPRLFLTPLKTLLCVFVLTLGASLLKAQTALPSVLHAASWEVIKTPSADRVQKLVSLAKAEGGTVSLYTSIAEKDLKVIFDPFEKKYGIKVLVWRASGDSVMTRTINEARAKRYSVDVFHAGAVELEALSREHLIQRVASPHFADLMEGSLPTQRVGSYPFFSLGSGLQHPSVQRIRVAQNLCRLVGPQVQRQIGL